MSTSDIAISVRGLAKSYVIAHQAEKYGTLAESLLHRLRNPFRRPTTETLWALKDVSFDINRGDVVGIIGRNGAGKSTLLKILSRITEPTQGEVNLYGRVGSLLEVGTGFHPELTGRENIFLNGAILGMARSEIRKAFDAIVDFAGVEQFLDTPVKRYSSGMYVRLAFAVAAHLNPEILIVDEVLAVGDREFQKKCLGKMTQVSKSGRTVLFVSHNLPVVEKLCHKGILLESGRVAIAAGAGAAIDRYISGADYGSRASFRGAERSGEPVSLIRAELLDADGIESQSLRFGEPFSIRLHWRHSKPVPAISYAVRVFDERGQFIFAVNTIGKEDLGIEAQGEHVVMAHFPNNVLPPGRYPVTIGAWVRPHSQLQVIEECICLVVESVPFDDGHQFEIAGSPAVAIRANWDRLEPDQAGESGESRSEQLAGAPA